MNSKASASWPIVLNEKQTARAAATLFGAGLEGTWTSPPEKGLTKRVMLRTSLPATRADFVRELFHQFGIGASCFALWQEQRTQG
jgi:hypothetical protein